MILTWLILIPLIGGFLCWVGERYSRVLPRWIAFFSMLLLLILTVVIWLQGDYHFITKLAGLPQWTVEYRLPWFPDLGASFHLGLDGLSLLLIALTGFLGTLAVACSWSEVQEHVGFFHLNLLWIIAGVVGVFLALDMLLFFFFWEMMLVPMFFLIALWGHNVPGGRGRIYAATKFFIYTQASGLLMLLSIITMALIYAQINHHLSFDYHDLLGLSSRMSPHLEWILMLGFVIAFSVKLPVVPLHAWLPDAHSQAPTAGSVDLAGILLKTAAYGFLRFALPLFPNASHQFAPIAMWLGVLGIFYGAILAYRQSDIKRLIAYTSVSHMGFVLIGIYSFNALATQGVVMQMLAHGISAAALFILSGQIYERMHTRNLDLMGGLWTRIRSLPPMALFFAAASVGLPGLGNFVGEFLILMGTYTVNHLITVVASGGMIVAAIYTLMMMQRAFFGPVQSETVLPAMNGREFMMMMSLVVVMVWLGVYPQPILNTSAAALDTLHHLMMTVLPSTTVLR
ncbi:MAG: NADH-quinone oxidoreductase subunit M [Pseudomonadales bacterium]|nr:NADH-quinone oxidoreductase subunit M [Pseudomonadales bacterium]